jgi:hypothetical protein
VNERIRRVCASFAVENESYGVFCECGRRDCVERLVVPTEIYERARDDARIYLVRPGHEEEYGDRVLDSHAAFSVVLAA